MELLTSEPAAASSSAVGGGQSRTLGGRPRRFFCGCALSSSGRRALASNARNGDRGAVTIAGAGSETATTGTGAGVFSAGGGMSSSGSRACCNCIGGGNSTSRRFMSGCHLGPGVHESMAGVIANGVGAYGVIANGPGVSACTLIGLFCSTSSPRSTASLSSTSVRMTLSSGYAVGLAGVHPPMGKCKSCAARKSTNSSIASSELHRSFASTHLVFFKKSYMSRHPGATRSSNFAKISLTRVSCPAVAASFFSNFSSPNASSS